MPSSHLSEGSILTDHCPASVCPASRPAATAAASDHSTVVMSQGQGHSWRRNWTAGRERGRGRWTVTSVGQPSAQKLVHYGGSMHACVRAAAGIKCNCEILCREG